MPMPVKSGIDLLRDPLSNRGTAFTLEERERLHLTGLLPPRVEAIDDQVSRVLAQVRARPSALDRFVYLAGLQNDNETLFFRALTDNLEELLPVVYTPTVGQACLEWSRIYQRPRGLYITPDERGRIASVLRRWPRRDVGIVVLTDGGRILGLGDLGANGMGIPIGKLALYVACGGVHPARCLPVMLDAGTDTDSVRNDPSYLGLRQPRLAGAAYDELVEEFVCAASDVFPGVLLQFEDFATPNAFRLLARYRHRVCAFNDDIQGTGAMALAGFYAAQRLTHRSLTEEKVVLFGAGSANVGIAQLLVAAMVKAGLPEEEARLHCWFVDSGGLVVKGRTGLAEHKCPFAHEHPPLSDLLAVVEAVRPTVLIGASGASGAFTAAVLAAMARIHERPVILALSNPTSKAECTAEDACRATQGRALYASGSPFPPVAWENRTILTGQANNSYIFPGLGLGVLATGATRVTDEMLLAAARALAAQTSAADLASGRLFPAASSMRAVAAAVAVAVADVAHDQGVAKHERPVCLDEHIRQCMYWPRYSDQDAAGC